MIKLPRPFNEWSTYDGHLGIDYPEPDDTMVRASGDGVVIYEGYFSERGGYGVTVFYYDNATTQSYKHSDIEDWRLEKGRVFSAFDDLMEIGGTGKGSTGPHLHHEVFVNGVIQTGGNYWKYVDKSENGYIGAPSPADTDSKPLEKEDEEMTPRQIHFTENGKTTRAILVPGTPYFMAWTEAGADYANEFARNMETGNSSLVTRSLYEAFKAAAERCAPVGHMKVEVVNT